MKTIIIDLSKCYECDEPMSDLHHIIPKSLGGKKTIPLCIKCHSLVHDRNFIKHRQLLIEGVNRAKAEGKFKGKKIGTKTKDSTYLKRFEKQIYQAQILINQGKSINFICNELNSEKYNLSINRATLTKLVKRNIIKKLSK